MTHAEINEQVALRLGWTKAYLGCTLGHQHEYGHWHTPNGMHSGLGVLGTDLPSWYTDPGCAFADLVPVLAKRYAALRIIVTESTASINPAGTDEFFFSNGECAFAEAACEAVIALVPVLEGAKS